MKDTYILKAHRQKEYTCLAAVGLFIAAISIPLAAIKAMGQDEIYTFAIARQPSLGAICAVLIEGADIHPPLDYWLRHLSMWGFGSSPLAFRLPSIIAICVASMLLFRLISRRLSSVYGITGVLFILLACGQVLALTGRPYALLICAYAAALYAWDSLASKPSSNVHRAMFALALATAMYSHYYGVLYFVAFGAAAVLQGVVERKWPVQPFVLIGLGGIASLPVLPLAIATSHYIGSSSWTPLTLTAALDFYPQLLGPAIPGWLFLAVLLGLGMALAQESDVRDEGEFPIPTVLALTASACLPFALFVLARFVTGAFLPRYVYATAVAICILSLPLAAKMPVAKRWLRPILVMVPLLFLAISVARQTRAMVFGHDRIDFVEKLKTLQQKSGQPVVLGDQGLFIELSYEHPEAIRNCYFLYDVTEGRQNHVDVTTPGLQKVMPLHAMTFNAWKVQHESFLFFGSWMDPVLARAVAEQADLKYHLGAEDGLAYWTVHLPASPRP